MKEEFMKILVLGASGYIGRKVREVLLTKHDAVYGTYCKYNREYENDNYMLPFELGNDEGLIQLLETTNPDFVISSLRGEFSLQLNAHEIIGDFLKKNRNKRMIYISTANVFDGAMEQPHVESDKPEAKSEYGKFKIECEELLSNQLKDNNIIIRIPGVWGKNCPRILEFIHNMKYQLPVQTYENIYMNYTTNQQIAEWIQYIIQNDLRGIFHIGSTDICEYHQFQEQLRQGIGGVNPIYQVEPSEVKLYQAVIPNRKEIPEAMQMTIEDIIDELAREHTSINWLDR